MYLADSMNQIESVLIQIYIYIYVCRPILYIMMLCAMYQGSSIMLFCLESYVYVLFLFRVRYTFVL